MPRSSLTGDGKVGLKKNKKKRTSKNKDKEKMWYRMEYSMTNRAKKRRPRPVLDIPRGAIISARVAEILFASGYYLDEHLRGKLGKKWAASMEKRYPIRLAYGVCSTRMCSNAVGVPAIPEELPYPYCKECVVSRVTRECRVNGCARVYVGGNLLCKGHASSVEKERCMATGCKNAMYSEWWCSTCRSMGARVVKKYAMPSNFEDDPAPVVPERRVDKPAASVEVDVSDGEDEDPDLHERYDVDDPLDFL